MGDIERALTTIREAVALTRDDDPDCPAMLNTLGNTLQNRFEKTGCMDDINQAIVVSEQAVTLTSDGHPDHAKYLNNLGNAFHQRFERTGSIGDLDRATHQKGAGRRINTS